MGRRAGRAQYNHAPQFSKRVQALEMRAKAATYREIAMALGVSLDTAHRWVNEEMKKVITPPSEHLVKLELMRYDRMMKRLEEELENGGDPVRVIPAMMRVSKGRRELLGMDAAVKVDATVYESTQEDLQLQELLREAKAYAATHEARTEDPAE